MGERGHSSDILKKSIKTQLKIVIPFLALFLMFGVVFAPARANAGFFSFGAEALASNNNLSNLPDTNKTSQTMDLLTPSVSMSSVSKNDNKNSNSIKDDAQVNVVSDSALLPSTSALGSASEDADISPDDVSIYVIKKGDTYAGIANMFDVSVNTILWANDLKKGDKLKEGDILIILPVSGIKHTVSKGQTLKSIAKIYNADVSDIAQFNNIAEDAKLSVGDELIIPDGVIVDNTTKKTTTNSKGRIPLYVETSLGSIDGYFIKPIPCPLTQGIHDHYAVDMSCHESGTPIKAAADGIVIFARDHSTNGGFGWLTIIKHPNGTETFYAHQSKILVSKGDSVKQGEVIGKVGSTGHSTGPHLHFEVRGAKNPGFDKTGNSWKLQ